MPIIQPGRFTARHDGPLVVFLIGMRINRFMQISQWLPVARAMGPMIDELTRDPDSGFLGAENLFQPWRTVLLTQYWRDFDSLERYARATDKHHLPAWHAFNQASRQNDSVGIFHETYLVPRRGLETIYANMPKFGLGKVAGTVPVTERRKTARSRITGIKPDAKPDTRGNGTADEKEEGA